jgi:hypothetical protein
MRLLFHRSAAAVLIFVHLLAAQAAAPERIVQGNVLTSQRDPAVRITVPASAHYVGADRFVLYDIADCELHGFVEADENKTVRQLYWIQFEQYLPSRPDLHHTYDSPRHTMLGGLDFYVDTWVEGQNDPRTPGSDQQHIEALIRAKGYKMPPGMMSVRLVHLLDEAKRKELMIIYSENLDSTGLSVESLKKGGSAYSRWPAIEKSLISRAEESITVQPLAKR